MTYSLTWASSSDVREMGAVRRSIGMAGKDMAVVGAGSEGYVEEDEATGPVGVDKS